MIILGRQINQPLPGSWLSRELSKTCERKSNMIWLNKKNIIHVLMGIIIYWFLDSAIDGYFFFHYTPHEILTHTLHAPAHEIFMRSTTIVIIILFGFFLIRYNIYLKESEGRYRQLFDNINDPIFVHTDVTEESACTFLEVNQAGCRNLGYNREELLRTSPMDIFASEGRRDLAPWMRQLLAEQHVLFETALVTKANCRIPVEVHAHRFDLRGKTRVLSIARDISERKQAEAALHKAYAELELRVAERTAELAQANLALQKSEEKLQGLTAQLMTATEQERQRISMELHDELGQALVYLKFQMGLLAQKQAEGEGIKNFDTYFNPLLDYLNGIIENVRRLSQDLSPRVLEELGISSAIRYLLEEFIEHHPIRIAKMEIDEIDELFSQPAQTHIFRVIQESLTNIFRHAHASQISVIVKNESDRVSIVVEDNGQGFDPQQVLSLERRGVGIAAMQERLRILGGTVDILSQEGAGTRITCNIPVEPKRTVLQ
jgi:PAS domain S-box-containing protein